MGDTQSKHSKQEKPGRHSWGGKSSDRHDKEQPKSRVSDIAFSATLKGTSNPRNKEESREYRKKCEIFSAQFMNGSSDKACFDNKTKGTEDSTTIRTTSTQFIDRNQDNERLKKPQFNLNFSQNQGNLLNETSIDDVKKSKKKQTKKERKEYTAKKKNPTKRTSFFKRAFRFRNKTRKSLNRAKMDIVENQPIGVGNAPWTATKKVILSPKNADLYNNGENTVQIGGFFGDESPEVFGPYGNRKSAQRRSHGIDPFPLSAIENHRDAGLKMDQIITATSTLSTNFTQEGTHNSTAISLLRSKGQFSTVVEADERSLATNETPIPPETPTDHDYLAEYDREEQRQLLQAPSDDTSCASGLGSRQGVPSRDSFRSGVSRVSFKESKRENSSSSILAKYLLTKRNMQDQMDRQVSDTVSSALSWVSSCSSLPARVRRPTKPSKEAASLGFKSNRVSYPLSNRYKAEKDQNDFRDTLQKLDEAHDPEASIDISPISKCGSVKVDIIPDKGYVKNIWDDISLPAISGINDSDTKTVDVNKTVLKLADKVIKSQTSKTDEKIFNLGGDECDTNKDAFYSPRAFAPKGSAFGVRLRHVAVAAIDTKVPLIGDGVFPGVDRATDAVKTQMRNVLPLSPVQSPPTPSNARSPENQNIFSEFKTNHSLSTVNKANTGTSNNSKNTNLGLSASLKANTLTSDNSQIKNLDRSTSSKTKTLTSNNSENTNRGRSTSNKSNTLTSYHTEKKSPIKKKIGAKFAPPTKTKGLVAQRVNMFNEIGSSNSHEPTTDLVSNTESLRSNRVIKSKDLRRDTQGDGVLAPRKATLRSPLFSVQNRSNFYANRLMRETPPVLTLESLDEGNEVNQGDNLQESNVGKTDALKSNTYTKNVFSNNREIAELRSRDTTKSLPQAMPDIRFISESKLDDPSTDSQTESKEGSSGQITVKTEVNESNFVKNFGRLSLSNVEKSQITTTDTVQKKQVMAFCEKVLTEEETIQTYDEGDISTNYELDSLHDSTASDDFALELAKTRSKNSQLLPIDSSFGVDSHVDDEDLIVGNSSVSPIPWHNMDNVDSEDDDSDISEEESPSLISPFNFLKERRLFSSPLIQSLETVIDGNIQQKDKKETRSPLLPRRDPSQNLIDTPLDQRITKNSSASYSLPNNSSRAIFTPPAQTASTDVPTIEKENVSHVLPSLHLGGASSNVTPGQLNLHGSPKSLCLSPTQRTPYQASKWRQRAAKYGSANTGTETKKKGRKLGRGRLSVDIRLTGL